MGFGKGNDVNMRYATSKELLKIVSGGQIFDHYLGGVPRGAINSPLRTEVHPSFSVFYSDNHDDFFFKDFKTGDRGDALVFVMRLFKFKKITDAINQVVVDFGLTQFRTNALSYSKPATKDDKDFSKIKKILKNKIDIRVTVRQWKKWDKKFWQDRYGLTKNQLEYCQVYPISHFFLQGYCSVAEKHAYVFVEEKDGIQTFKLYQPYSKDHKWLNNNNYSVWELWTQMPETGDVCIIASSRKDSMVIKSLFPSDMITSCSLQSESVNPKSSVMEELKNRFNHVFVMYDNDQFSIDGNAGKLAGEKLANNFDILDILIPDVFQLKDPSDFIEKQGEENTRNMIISLIKERIKQYNN
jgi:hypothetical protein